MQKVLTLSLLILTLTVNAQQYDYSIGRQTEYVDSVREWLADYERIGVKSTGSEGLKRTRDWIAERYKSFGYPSIQMDSFIYQGDTLQNIIIEKEGSRPGHWIIIGAHYDSYPNSTGTNDNGSGVIACMQIAKILKDIPTRYGIRFIHFSAEENGLKGSEHYVANSLSASDTIHLMFNLDQLGGTLGAYNGKIVCERDESPSPAENNAASALITDTLAQLIRNYTFLEPVIDRAYSSDYMPFQDAGMVITGLYQESHDPFNHSAQDGLDKMDTEATHQVIQGALAAAMHFAGHLLPLGVPDLDRRLPIYPNPARDLVHLPTATSGCLAELFNLQGQLVHAEVLHGSKLMIPDLRPGCYHLRIFSAERDSIQSARLIIAH